MSSEQSGLYEKYVVIKKVDGTTITDCFILVPEKDPAAVVAMQAYAAATENKALADDIYRWVGKPLRKPMTLTEANSCQDPVWIEFKIFDTANGWRSGMCDALHWASRVYKGLQTVPQFGVHYRIWAFRPTAEEREAAPWEERHG